MITLFDAASSDPAEDQLVLIGDLIDRGPDFVEVIRLAKKWQEQHPKNILVVLGNHEIMMRQYIFGGTSHMWLRYGGLEVIEEMKSRFQGIAERNDHLVWLANLPLTHSDDEYFYVHAGFDISRDVMKQHEDSTFISLNKIYSIKEKELKKVIGNRMIVHGHIPYSYVYRAGNFISCDTGASVLPNGKLSLINLSNQTYFCTETNSNEVHSLPIQRLDMKKRMKK